MFLFALLACETGSVVLDDSGGPTETDTDTDADSDTDTDADSDTDTDTDTDTDPADLMEGDYEGFMDGMQESEWDSYDCSGDIYFSIDADGVLEGEAECDFGGGYAYGGTLEGEVDANGDVTAGWLVDFGWGEPWEMGVEGVWDAGSVSLEFYEDFGRGGIFTGTMEAEKQ